VIKIERPGRGDEMRSYQPKFGADSVNFALLNRGKRSIALDLKQPGAVEKLLPLLQSADVIVEQYRPGVMDRLGLGYAALNAINPRIIYCAITGYGQSGPRAEVAAHDLNYVAEAGMLALAAGADGAPVVPSALVADIGGGTYPAVINILLALRERDRTGRGCKLDIAMGENLFAFMYWRSAMAWREDNGRRREAISSRAAAHAITSIAPKTAGSSPPRRSKPSSGRTSARSSDLRPSSGRQPRCRGDQARGGGKNCAKTADEWRALFAGKDLCCCIVGSIEAALRDPHFAARGVFAAKLAAEGRQIAALPVPWRRSFVRSPAWRDTRRSARPTRCSVASRNGEAGRAFCYSWALRIGRWSFPAEGRFP